MTVAVALLAFATVAVVLAVPTQSPVWLTFSSVLALACGWAAARIVYSELAQSRRDNARDRAQQAQAYREMFAERAVEHAAFTTSMTDRMRRADVEVAELQDSIVAAQRRAAEAESEAARGREGRAGRSRRTGARRGPGHLGRLRDRRRPDGLGGEGRRDHQGRAAAGGQGGLTATHFM